MPEAASNSLSTLGIKDCILREGRVWGGEGKEASGGRCFSSQGWRCTAVMQEKHQRCRKPPHSSLRARARTRKFHRSTSTNFVYCEIQAQAHAERGVGGPWLRSLESGVRTTGK